MESSEEQRLASETTPTDLPPQTPTGIGSGDPIGINPIPGTPVGSTFRVTVKLDRGPAQQAYLDVSVQSVRVFASDSVYIAADLAEKILFKSSTAAAPDTVTIDETISSAIHTVTTHYPMPVQAHDTHPTLLLPSPRQKGHYIVTVTGHDDYEIPTTHVSTPLRVI